MDWKTKAFIQRVCDALPFGQEALYYFMQRRFGSLRHPPDPLPMLAECVRLAGRLDQAGVAVEGSRVMEIGAGRRLDFPIGLYLCGAASILSVDLYPILKPRLVMQSLDAVRRRREEVRSLFLDRVGAPALDRRLDRLCRAADFTALLAVAGIQYRAPADAAAMDLPAGGIDIQISYTVFEHIPHQALLAILREANRLLAPNGVALHHIDPSDHFAHEDRSILPVNFLRYSDRDWAHLAGNRFAYHNRLRASDYERLYREAGHDILQWEPRADPRSVELLRAGFPVDARFRGAPEEALATTVLHVLSRPRARERC